MPIAVPVTRPAGAAACPPAEEVLSRAVEEGVFPGAAACAGSSAGTRWLAGIGRLEHGKGAAVSADTIYDIASLTKVVATASCLMRLVDAGRLALSIRASRLIPQFTGGGREEVTVEHLLTHSSGLPAWRPLFREARTPAEAFSLVVSTPLERRPGEKESYSDLGAILLGECAARAGGSPLGTLSWRLVLDPLAMRDTGFRPPASCLPRIAPTEMDAAFRGRLIRGEVHDENAFALGGVAGHAGLFSTAADIARFGAELLRALRGGSALFSAGTARLFTARRGMVPGSSRALGWDTRADAADGSGPGGSRSSSGRLFGARSFGHTGFTGTSIWFDPDRDLFAALFSNAVHPSRSRGGMLEARRAFHDAVAGHLG